MRQVHAVQLDRKVKTVRRVSKVQPERREQPARKVIAVEPVLQVARSTDSVSAVEGEAVEAVDKPALLVQQAQQAKTVRPARQVLRNRSLSTRRSLSLTRFLPERLTATMTRSS